MYKLVILKREVPQLKQLYDPQIIACNPFFATLRIEQIEVCLFLLLLNKASVVVHFLQAPSKFSASFPMI